MYVKNADGERLLVYVMSDGVIIPKYPDESLEGFDLAVVYCLGCSWFGSSKSMPVTHY